MNKTSKTVLLILLAVILVGGGVFVGINWNNWFGKDDTPVTADLDEMQRTIPATGMFTRERRIPIPLIFPDSRRSI